MLGNAEAMGATIGSMQVTRQLDSVPYKKLSMIPRTNPPKVAM
jgi:hypothetical protein